MTYGMPTLIENHTLEDNIALCRRLGLRFIELNMNFPEYQVDTLARTDALKRAAEQAGIHFTLHLDETLNVADFNPLVRQAYLETVRQALAAAKALTALCAPGRNMIVNMHMNHGIFVTLPDRKVQLYERDFDRYMRSFAEFRALCEDGIGGSPVRIAVENTDGFREYEEKAIDFLLESPVFGLTWDIGHSKATGERDMPFLMSRRDRLIHFHIHDGTQTPPRNHLALGNGEIDLEARLALARSRDARCVLETKTIDALTRSVQWLKDRHLWEEQEACRRNPWT